jgi:hypothetical protein
MAAGKRELLVCSLTTAPRIIRSTKKAIDFKGKPSKGSLNFICIIRSKRNPKAKYIHSLGYIIRSCRGEFEAESISPCQSAAA